MIVVKKQGGQFCYMGDSSSAVFNDSGEILGILFAGTSRALLTPIDQITADQAQAIGAHGALACIRGWAKPPALPLLASWILDHPAALFDWNFKDAWPDSCTNTIRATAYAAIFARFTSCPRVDHFLDRPLDAEWPICGSMPPTSTDLCRLPIRIYACPPIHLLRTGHGVVRS